MKTTDQKLHDLIQSRATYVSAENDITMITTAEKTEIYVIGNFKDVEDMKEFQLQAQAQSQANLILAKSITPELVQYKSIEVWDGKLPVVTSGATPFINMQNLTAPGK